MKVNQFLDHYGISENPFSQEDAQSDRIFQEYLLKNTRHAAWDKVLGSPATPSTAVVFGEQGSGKTAMRFQLVSEIREHNKANPQVVGCSSSSMTTLTRSSTCSGRSQRLAEEAGEALQNWRLWDHTGRHPVADPDRGYLDREPQ